MNKEEHLIAELVFKICVRTLREVDHESEAIKTGVEFGMKYLENTMKILLQNNPLFFKDQIQVIKDTNLEGLSMEQALDRMMSLGKKEGWN